MTMSGQPPLAGAVRFSRRIYSLAGANRHNVERMPMRRAIMRPSGSQAMLYVIAGLVEWQGLHMAVPGIQHGRR